MHSSRMRTVRSSGRLSGGGGCVCSGGGVCLGGSALGGVGYLLWGVSAPGGVSAVGDVCSRGGVCFGGLYPTMH